VRAGLVGEQEASDDDERDSQSKLEIHGYPRFAR
jgi:hypothetical protein